MSDAILIFTFSPIQPFIAEARRAADLYAGSQILVELAQSAAEVLGKDRLIFPSAITDDMPNKMVARVPWEACRQLAEAAQEKLLYTWREEIAQQAAVEFLTRFNNPPLPFNSTSNWKDAQGKASVHFDSEWDAVWGRQTGSDYLWEIYWAAAKLDSDTEYLQSYRQAEKALAAVKRTRAFAPADEPGIKDSLSGRRQALHTKHHDAKTYWANVIKLGRVTPAKLRSGELLDAIGLIKRFSSRASRSVRTFKGFPSTSSVASIDFLAKAQKAPEVEALKSYRDQIAALLNYDEKFSDSAGICG